MTALRPALFLLAVSAFAADYEVLIRNARVLDGTGNPWFGADAGIRDGRIAAAGNLSKATAYKTVDAANRVLAPGTFNFRDRGLIREGMAADLVLFDPAKVQDKATYPQPHQFSEGFDLVLVNGAPVVEGGKLTAAKPGKVLRGR